MYGSKYIVEQLKENHKMEPPKELLDEIKQIHENAKPVNLLEELQKKDFIIKQLQDTNNTLLDINKEITELLKNARKELQILKTTKK